MPSRPLRIHHVVADIHRQDSGPSYSVTRLAEELAKLGHDVHLHTLEPTPERLPDVPTTFYRAPRPLHVRRDIAAACAGACRRRP